MPVFRHGIAMKHPTGSAGDPLSALEGVLSAAVRNLTPAQAVALAAHPEVVRSALTAVAATLSREQVGSFRGGAGDAGIALEGSDQLGVEESTRWMSAYRRSGRSRNPLAGTPRVGDGEAIVGEGLRRVGAEEARRRISAHLRPGEGENLLTSDEFAARVRLRNRQSVHNWMKKRRIVGWQGARRGFVFPAGQLDERGRPLDGLAEIVPHFADDYAAWVWLTTPQPLLDGKTPLHLLKRGRSDRVADVARGEAQGDFT